MSLLTEIKSAQIPAHIAIIMDGNGRWAKQRNLPRTSGHKEGLEVAKKIVKAAKEVGVKYITLYTFSTENWKRTQDEVGYLMGLIKNHSGVARRPMPDKEAYKAELRARVQKVHERTHALVDSYKA